MLGVSQGIEHMTEPLKSASTFSADEEELAFLINDEVDNPSRRKHNTERILAVIAILIALLSCCLTVPSFFTDAVGLPLGISSLFDKTHPDATATEVALLAQKNTIKQATVLVMEEQVHSVQLTSIARGTPAPTVIIPAPISTPSPEPLKVSTSTHGIRAGGLYGVDNELVNQQARQLGFGWIGVKLPWEEVEQTAGTYTWAAVDRMVSNLSAGGLKLLVVVSNAPLWARPANADTVLDGPPVDPQTYASFVGQLAERYCGEISVIEVWEDQNMFYGWGGEPIDPKRYMALLRSSYRAIKASCPEMLVLSGALTPIGGPLPESSTTSSVQPTLAGFAMDDFEYLNQMYAQGLKVVSDEIGVKPDGYNIAPDIGWDEACDFVGSRDSLYLSPCRIPSHHWSFRSTMEGYRNIIVAHGDANKRLWPVQFGWCSSDTTLTGMEYCLDVTATEQAEWTARAYQMMKAWGWVGVAFYGDVYSDIGGFGDAYSLYDAQGEPKPIYQTLKEMPK